MCADLFLMQFNLVNEHAGQKNKWKDKLLSASSILLLKKKTKKKNTCIFIGAEQELNSGNFTS